MQATDSDGVFTMSRRLLSTTCLLLRDTTRAGAVRRAAADCGNSRHVAHRGPMNLASISLPIAPVQPADAHPGAVSCADGRSADRRLRAGQHGGHDGRAHDDRRRAHRRRAGLPAFAAAGKAAPDARRAAVGGRLCVPRSDRHRRPRHDRFRARQSRQADRRRPHDADRTRRQGHCRHARRHARERHFRTPS